MALVVTIVIATGAATLWLATPAGAAQSPSPTEEAHAPVDAPDDAPPQARDAHPLSPGTFTPFVAIVGALIAAAVGLFNVWTNQRFNLRSQRDSQFYEALKRFGEESPSVRSSAAGLLAQMGTTEVSTETGLRALWHRAAAKPYLMTSFDQLVTGLLLEDNRACISSAASALTRLIPEVRDSAFEKVRALNVDAQERMCDLQARLWGLWNTNALPADLADERWRWAAYYAGLSDLVLARLLRNHARDFGYRMEDYRRGFAALGEEERRARQLELREAIHVCGIRLGTASRLAAESIVHNGEPDRPRRRFKRLYLVGASFQNVRLEPCSFDGSMLSRANLGKASLHDCVFNDADLEGAFLVNARLEGAAFHGANLTSANLESARLKNARLHGARIDQTTRMRKADWWRANFYNRRDQTLDKPLLDLLFCRYGEAVPADDREVHMSVVEYRNRYPEVRATLMIRNHESIAPGDDLDDDAVAVEAGRSDRRAVLGDRVGAASRYGYAAGGVGWDGHVELET